MHPTVEGVVELQIHGASPDFIRGMRDAGYTSVSADNL